jgi:hypothetical protein
VQIPEMQSLDAHIFHRPILDGHCICSKKGTTE